MHTFFGCLRVATAQYYQMFISTTCFGHSTILRRGIFNRLLSSAAPTWQENGEQVTNVTLWHEDHNCNSLCEIGTEICSFSVAEIAVGMCMGDFPLRIRNAWQLEGAQS
jgi:hypothetical protein